MVSQTTYAELWALIGHTYATNPGGGNFTLPDFQGYLPIGVASTSPTALNTLGKVAGDWDHRHEQNAIISMLVETILTVFPATDSAGAKRILMETLLPFAAGVHEHTLSENDLYQMGRLTNTRIPDVGAEIKASFRNSNTDLVS